MELRDKMESIFTLSNGDSVDLIITRSNESDVTDEDFQIILQNTYLEKLVFCDIIDISFYKEKNTQVKIDKKIILAGLPGIKVVIGNYIKQ